MTIGDLGETIPSQNVKVFLNNEELILVSDVKIIGGRHVINTLNTRAAPIDSYQWILREIEATVAWTEDLQSKVVTANTLDSKSAFPIDDWTVKGLNIGTNVNNDTEFGADAVLYDYSINAPETGTSTITLKLRIERSAT